MSLSRNIRGLHFFIAGAASSGISVAKLLKKNGANIFITDENKISDKIKNEINELNLAFEENGHSFNKIINECDILVISPGIPLHKEISILCKKNYIPILSEIEIASWFMNPNSLSLGVTGTNGKSTTVNYLSQLFFNSKYKIKACGNIGVSVSQTITENPETNLFAIEFSSYQLETTYSIRPICTALLNIQNDHLARYEDMNEYLKAKWRLILLTDDNGLAIIDKNIMNHVLKLGLSLPRSKIILIDESNSRKESKNLKLEPILNSIQFGKTLPNAIYQQLNTLSFENIILPNQFDSAYAEYNIDGSISISLNYNNIAKNWNIKTPCIPGRHNMTNILCANLIAMHLGISDEIILNQWEEKTSNYLFC